MISVVVCSRREPEWDYHERNVIKTIDCEYEYIRIDNSENTYSICSAYNEGVSRSQGDILVFVHEDVFFMEPGWGNVLARKFEKDDALGLVGVAGTQYLSRDHAAWLAAGQPFIRGRVLHETDGGDSFYLSVFSWEKEDAEVVAVDGLFFAIRRDLFQHIRFDEDTFDGFHFYDLDICMQVRKTHKLIVTWDLLVKHLSAGNCDKAWEEAGQRFLAKYKEGLPAHCVDSVPVSKQVNVGTNYNLKGLVSQNIII